jgi:uncharacterized protein
MMVKPLLRYDMMVEKALRGVVREALAVAAERGLPGSHHFYITFRTDMASVEIPDSLKAQYPHEMTIVLEHQFWDLQVDERQFSVTLSFRNLPQRLTVPFAAVTAFSDPSVKFGLEFRLDSEREAAADGQGLAKLLESEWGGDPVSAPGDANGVDRESGTDGAAKGDDKTGEVVKLDLFRKK